MSPGHAFSFLDIFLKLSLIAEKSITVINYVKYLDTIGISLFFYSYYYWSGKLKTWFFVPWTCFSKNKQKHQEMRKNELNLVSKYFYFIWYTFFKITNELLWKISFRLYQIRQFFTFVPWTCFWRNHRLLEYDSHLF